MKGAKSTETWIKFDDLTIFTPMIAGLQYALTSFSTISKWIFLFCSVHIKIDQGMKSSKFYWLFGFGISLFLLSCDSQGDKLPKINDLKDGRYEIVEAFRNGKKTKSLDNAFYEVLGDTIKTNLTKSLDSLASKYSVSDGEITHENPLVLPFTVAKNTSDTLELNTQLKSFKFDLILVKSDSLNEE